ncbi:hypothetical protein NDU88_005214 [Pleurodeles waltl]|uniref:Secreted protein n=1 Tax=Pleurodeles waltl TaxID=8319 RepID=A0AAV7RJI9_PLEWA|nr:hypothetical protein NDU88_005214 [Pleurodeles waltl]
MTCRETSLSILLSRTPTTFVCTCVGCMHGEMCMGAKSIYQEVTGHLSPRLRIGTPNPIAHTPGVRPRGALTRKRRPIRISGNQKEKAMERDEGRHPQE